MIKLARQFLGVTIIAFSTPLLAQLSLSPHEIEVSDVSQSKQMRITFEGRPVLPEEILKITAGVTKTGAALPKNSKRSSHFSDYSFMFDFKTGDDGVITLTPNEELVQVGSYDLVIKTVHGTARGVVNANLRESIPPPPPRTSGATKLTYDLTLADYTYGQPVSIVLTPDPNNTYTWFIDGKTYFSGQGETSFRAWPEPGVHEISYVARNPDGEVVSSWSGTTTVSEEPAIETTLRKGYKVPFYAPSGYTQVTWTLDGRQVAENYPERSASDSHLLRFRKKGSHVLTCLARDAETGGFRKVTWTIKVK